MGSDVAHATSCARLLRVGAPCCLLLSFGVDRISQPALWVFHYNFADLTEVTIGDHVARLLDHWVASVGVGEAEEFA